MIARLLLVIASIWTFGLTPSTAYAASPVTSFPVCQQGVVTDSDICNAAAGGSKLFGAGGIWNSILNTVTYVIGAIAVLMIIIGAVRYALSGGDQSTVTGAKNTIIYALVALIVAVMANALVNFVLTNI